jgi:hypothetical protein
MIDVAPRRSSRSSDGGREACATAPALWLESGLSSHSVPHVQHLSELLASTLPQGLNRMAAEEERGLTLRMIENSKGVHKKSNALLMAKVMARRGYARGWGGGAALPPATAAAAAAAAA